MKYTHNTAARPWGLVHKYVLSLSFPTIQNLNYLGFLTHLYGTKQKSMSFDIKFNNELVEQFKSSIVHAQKIQACIV